MLQCDDRNGICGGLQLRLCGFESRSHFQTNMRLKTKLELVEMALERLTKASQVDTYDRGRNLYGLSGSLQEQIDDLQIVVQKIEEMQMQIVADVAAVDDKIDRLLDHFNLEEVHIESHIEIQQKNGV